MGNPYSLPKQRFMNKIRVSKISYEHNCFSFKLLCNIHQGALVGGISGLVIMAWWCLTSQLAIARGQIAHAHKSLSTEGCTYNFTIVESVIEETVFR